MVTAKHEWTPDELRIKLAWLAGEHGSQAALAEHLGVSAQWLNDILCGRRPVSTRVYTALGFQKVIRYVEVGQ